MPTAPESSFAIARLNPCARASLLFLPLIFTLLCSPPPALSVYRADKSPQLADSSLTALYVPLHGLSIRFAPQKSLAELKKGSPLYLFSKKEPVRPQTNTDSFYVDMANALACSEIAARFRIFAPDTALPDTGLQKAVSACGRLRWSSLAKDPGPSDSLGALVKDLAARCAVDLVVIPYACSLIEVPVKGQGWRGDKYGSYYQKPASVEADARFHIQIWDKRGTLLFERIGKGLDRQPPGYRVFKQDDKIDGDPVAFSKNLFAPTLVRALGMACRDALDFH